MTLRKRRETNDVLGRESRKELFKSNLTSGALNESI